MWRNNAIHSFYHTQMRQNILLFILFGAVNIVFAQDTDILLNHDLYHYIDRLDIRGYTGKTVHTDIKPYGRKYIAEVFEAADSAQMDLNELRWHRQMRKLADDDFTDKEKEGYLKFKEYYPNKINSFIYANRRDFYAYTSKNFRIYINPAMQFMVGGELFNGDSAKFQMLSINSRGVQVRGSFMNKIGFFTEVYDNVMRLPSYQFRAIDPDGTYTKDERLVFPGETYVKRFARNANSLDFFSTRAYITYSPFKAMRLKFGYDRSLWGNGNQSMMLSDHSANALALDINTRIWKLEYQNRFAQLIDYFPNKNDVEGTFPRKYAVFHQLSYKPTKNLSVGVFESVIYNPYQPNGKRGFELQYLNPIIFYRSAEQALGSPDNGLMGFTGKYNFFQHFQLYGQFLIDDFKFSAFKNRLLDTKEMPGYRNDKTAYQLGFKYIDMFNISTLDMQIEFNNVRPYTYQHFNATTNYSQYGQSLGYGFGGNARNLEINLNYHPFPRWNFQASALRGVKGNDLNGKNYGGNINSIYSELLPKSPINSLDYGYFVGFGDKINITQLYGRISYQILDTDIFAEIEGRYRQENAQRSASVWGGLRMNIAPRVAKY